MSESNNYNRNIIVKEEKTLTVFLWLVTRKKVNYDLFYEEFGANIRTFRRVIATIRQCLDKCYENDAIIIYNRNTKSYELIRAY